MTVNPTGKPLKAKFADRYMENQVKFVKSLIPEGPSAKEAMERIGRSLHFYNTCLEFSEQTFGAHQEVCSSCFEMTSNT